LMKAYLDAWGWLMLMVVLPIFVTLLVVWG
jgi:hypothetical protein